MHNSAYHSACRTFHLAAVHKKSLLPEITEPLHLPECPFICKDIILLYLRQDEGILPQEEESESLLDCIERFGGVGRNAPPLPPDGQRPEPDLSMISSGRSSRTSILQPPPSPETSFTGRAGSDSGMSCSRHHSRISGTNTTSSWVRHRCSMRYLKSSKWFLVFISRHLPAIPAPSPQSS